MAIPNWLIPSGEILFKGSEQQLRAAIGSLEGKLRSDGSFTCKLGGGPNSFRFHMASLFRCAYTKDSGGLRITWQVMPVLSICLLLAGLVLMALFGVVTANWELSGYTLCLLTFLVFLYAIQRGSCIEQFRERFDK